MKKTLLVMGGSYMNLQMKIDPRTKHDDLTSGMEYRFHPYGDAAAAAIAAAKLGGDCTFATKFGDDMNGKRLYEYYRNCGIKTDAMHKDKSMQTGMSVTVWSDLESHETYLSRGASGQFTKDEIDGAFLTIPDLFLAPTEELGVVEHTEMRPQKPESAEGENGMPKEEVLVPVVEKESLSLYAIREAEKRKIEMLLHYTPFTASYPLETITGVKALVISDEMLYRATGFFPNTTDKTLRSLVALSQKIKAKYYIVQQGNDGVFVYDGKYYETYRAPERLSAGEKREGAKMNPTFIGALATEYLESKNILRAARFATIVSLLSRGKFGTLEKMMTKDEITAYTTEHNIFWEH